MPAVADDAAAGALADAVDDVSGEAEVSGDAVGRSPSESVA